MKQLLIILLLSICGCHRPDLIEDEYSEYVCAGVKIKRIDNPNGTLIDLSNVDRDVISIRRTPEDWNSILIKIQEICKINNPPDLPQGYYHDYITDNKIRYRLHAYSQNQNDCAFLELWHNNIKLKNELLRLKGVKVENDTKN